MSLFAYGFLKRRHDIHRMTTAKSDRSVQKCQNLNVHVLHSSVSQVTPICFTDVVLHSGKTSVI